PCRVVHVGGLDVTPADGLEPDALAAAEVATVGGALAAAQALVAAGAGELWIVTRGAQLVGGTDVAAEQAPLWGFGRVVAVEHPERWGGLIDLAPGMDAEAAAAAVLAEIADNDGEDQVALRDGDRLVPRLVRTSIPAAAPISLRADGAYLL